MFRAVSHIATRSSLLQRQAIAPLSSIASSTPSAFSFSTSNTSDNDKYFHRTSFVHPLSQIVLEYLQSSKSSWLLQQGLDHSLTIKPDGSFEIKYPLLNHVNPPNPPARIFTYYDPQEAKHYLMVQKGYLNERYMLQDNKASPWHANKKSVYERIHVCVDHLIGAVDRMDGLEMRRGGK